jgi:transposase
MSFGVSLDEGELEYSSNSALSLFAQKRNLLSPRFWSMLSDLVRFYREAPAHWTLDALAERAQAEGIRVGRSQVRQILLREGARWRGTRSWMTSTDPDFVPKEPRSSPATPPRRRRRP